MNVAEHMDPPNVEFDTECFIASPSNNTPGQPVIGRNKSLWICGVTPGLVKMSLDWSTSKAVK